MKRYGRITGILLGGALLFAVSFGFAGCRQEEPEGITGSFCTLQEAYDAGFLTHDDLMSIAYYHNEGREYNEEIIPEDFQPVPLVPLDEETEAAIIRTYLEEYSKEANIIGYMGTYGRCAIVRMYNLPYVVPTIWDITVSGIRFVYPNWIPTSVWVKD